MVVLATNRPSGLDPAVIDRMDEALELRSRGHTSASASWNSTSGSTSWPPAPPPAAPAPAPAARPARLRAALGGRGSDADRITVSGVGEEELWEAANQTEGFSGRELAKFMASVQAAVYGAHEPVLTAAMFRRVLALKVHEHTQRRAFVEGTAAM